MFNYTDPVGTGILATQNALDIFRDLLESVYVFATRDNNAFEKLELIPPASPTEFIEWPAFPITANQDDLTIDSRRFEFQDEYVEWRVERDATGDVSIITFTTEFPEYYQALAEVGEDALFEGIRDAIPEANPTTAEVFGAGFDPSTASSQERSEAFRSQNVVPFPPPFIDTVPNPWNNNEKGILCLAQPFNTLGALFNLARVCSIPNNAIPATGQCAAVGNLCGENRNSDPQICTRAQEVAQIPRVLSLQDPVGVVILRLRGTWRIGNNVIDINDPNANNGIWRISRNGRRATLRIADQLTVNNEPIVTGAQISHLLDVGAEVISAPPGDLLPSIAAAAASTRQVPMSTRSMQ